MMTNLIEPPSCQTPTTPKPKQAKWRRLVRTAFIGIGGLWLLTELCFPWAINQWGIKEQLQQAIQKETGAIVSFKTMALHWVPWQGLWLAVQEPTLENPQHVKLAEGKAIGVRVDYGSLLWGGKANVRELVIQDGNLDLTNPSDWSFYQPKSGNPPDWIEVRDFKLNVVGLKLTTVPPERGHELKSHNMALVISNSALTFWGVDLLRLASKMPHDARLEASLGASVFHPQKVVDLSFQSEVNLAEWSLEALSHSRSFKTPRFSGTLSVRNLDLTTLKTMLPENFQQPLLDWEGILPKAEVTVENGAGYRLKTYEGQPGLMLSAQVVHQGENRVFFQGKALPKAQIEGRFLAKELKGSVSSSSFEHDFAKLLESLSVEQIHLGIRKSDDLQRESISLDAQEPKGLLLSAFLKRAVVTFNINHVDLKNWQDLLAFSPELQPWRGASGQLQLRLNQNGLNTFSPTNASWNIRQFSLGPLAAEHELFGLKLKGLTAEGTWSPQNIALKTDAESLLGRPFYFEMNASSSGKQKLPNIQKFKIQKFKLDWQQVALADVCRLTQTQLVQEKFKSLASDFALPGLACRGTFSSTLSWQDNLSAPDNIGSMKLEDVSVFFEGKKRQPVSVVSNLKGSLVPVALPLNKNALKWQVNGQVLSGQLSSEGQILPRAKRVQSQLSWRAPSINTVQKNLVSLLQKSDVQIETQGKIWLNAAGRYTWDSNPARFIYDLDLKGSELSVARKGDPALIQQGQLSFKTNSQAEVSGKLTGNLLKQPIQVTLQQFHQNAPAMLEIVFSNLNLETISSQLNQMKHLRAALPGVLNQHKNSVFDLKEMSGKGQGSVRLTFPKGIAKGIEEIQNRGKLMPGNTLSWQAKLNLAQLKFKLNSFKNPLEIHQIQASGSDATGLNLAPTRFKMGEFAGNVALVSQSGKQFKLALDTDKTSLASIRELIENWDAGKTGIQLPQLWQVAGDIQLSALVMNNQTQLKVLFDDAGASWQGGDFPIYQVNGAVILDESGQLSSEGLTGRYANSPFEIGFQYHPHSGAITTQGQLEASPLLLTHMLIPRDMTHWLESSLNSQFAIQGAIPNLVKLSSAKNELSGTFQAAVPSQLKLSTGFLNLFDLDTQVHVKGQALEVVRGRLNILESGGIDFKGYLEDLMPDAGQAQTMAFQFKTPDPIDLSKFSERVKKELGATPLDAKTDWVEGLHGKLDTDLKWEKDGDGNGDIAGYLNVDALAVPRWDLSDLTLAMGFQGQSGELDLKRFAIPGADLAIKAFTENVLKFPVRLEGVQIQGQSVNLTQMAQFIENVFVPRIQNGVLLPVLRPPKAWEPLFPVEFRNAKVSLDEMVYQNIIMTDFKGDLTTFSSGFTELRHVNFNAAGGSVEGSMAMNPRNQNFFTLELYPKNVKANALIRALLKQSNIMYGDVNGVIRFTTQGLTNDDMVKNANGVTQLSIENGRLPQIARIETLLTGANILRGGLVGLNLNNLIRAVQPFETNYFSKLTGDFQIASGVLYTNNLSSDGDNLDLDIGGWIRLLDGVAALEVTGAMSQDVTGVLGHLGKFSVGRLIRFIPGIGFLPNSRTGLLGIIPGIGFVPGFGGPAQDVNRFQIRVNGPLDDPSSIKGMKWLQESPDALNADVGQPKKP
jgi:hypothetical protein